MNLQEMSPSEIDTILAELWGQYDELFAKAARARKAARNAFAKSYVAELEQKAAEYTAQADAVLELTKPYDEEWRRRGCWNRYFLVNNKDGHVHRGTGCKTTRRSTRFIWLIELAAKTDADLIAAYGHIACTVCFPAAPVVEKPVPAGRCTGSKPAEIIRRNRKNWADCTDCGKRVQVNQNGLLRQHQK